MANAVKLLSQQNNYLFTLKQTTWQNQVSHQKSYRSLQATPCEILGLQKLQKN